MRSLQILLSVLSTWMCLCVSGAYGGNVEFVKKVMDAPLTDIQWADLQSVYMLTSKGSIYHSTDGGRSWTNQANKMSSSPISSITISTVNSQYVFFTGKNKGSYMTTDGGKSYHAVDGLDLQDIRLHPTKSSYILASSRSPGCNSAASGACFKSLYASMDFGLEWRHLLDYVVQFDWSPVVGTKDKDGNHGAHDTIYVTAHNNKNGNQKFGLWDKDIDFISSNDYFKSSQVLVPHGNRFLFGDHAYLFVAAVNPNEETQVTLKVSRDNGTRVNFHSAVLPVELTEHSYTILDTSEGSVFLHVNHAPVGDSAYSGHVYISDYSGLSYSLSLPYNHRAADGKCDFEKIQGLDGIYLANFVDEEMMDQEEREETRMDPNTKSVARKQRQRVKTVISYDKGGEWHYLTAPSVDFNNQQIPCNGECHLHLHGTTDPYGPFYSNQNAIGLVMGTGTVGTYLGGSADGINTYLSRDAGLTWSQVAKGSHIYEYGDHGSLIVMAVDSVKSDSILYSWDEGDHWTPLKISDDPFVIENIITEPDSTSQQFIVYGSDNGGGVMIYVNFDELHASTCKGYEDPDSSNSDYETWIPSDGKQTNNKCLLGRTTTYVRRKRNAKCFNPEAFERPIQVENCPCTIQDFECDYGYERKPIDTKKSGDKRNAHIVGECVPMVNPPQHPDIFGTKESCEFNSYYRITKGYRRVPGDSCVGGSEWEATMIACPSSFFGSSHWGKIIFVFLLLIVVSLIGVTAATKYDLVDTVLGYWDFARDRVGRFRHEYGILGQSQAPQSLADDADAFYLSDEDGHQANLIDTNTNSKGHRNESDVENPKTNKSSSSALSSTSSSSTSSIPFSSLPVIRDRANIKVPVLPGPDR